MTKGIAGLTAVLVAIAVSAGLLVSPSNPVTVAPVAPASPCIVPVGGGPGYDASIGNRQSGDSICITVGERLLVLLSGGAPNATPWRAIHLSTSGVLEYAPLTLMLSRGLTGANFRATRLGRVELSAERPVCAAVSPASPTCDAIESWRATVIVGASPNVTSKPSGSGIYGFVMEGPTCPVERIGRPCPLQPVVAEVDVRNVNANAVETAHTNGAGRYLLSLSPGRYAVKVITKTLFPRCPGETVTVRSGSPLRVDIQCDTGIR